MLLLAAGGIVFALIRWKLHPRVSLMTVIALVLLVIDIFFYTTILYFLPDIFRPMNLSSKAVDWLFFFVYFFDDFVYALIIILLFMAAFSQRSATPANSNA